jgi:molybdate transport system substrate-binding protein
MKDMGPGDGMEILKNSLIKTIAVANPATAPYGVAAISAMKQAGMYDAVKNKIVYGESIAQVNQYLLSGVADVAFTAKSVVMSPELKNKGKWTRVSDSLYQPIEQGVIILKYAKEHDLKGAEAFYHFLFSAEGKAVFRTFGYEVH